MSIRHVFKKMQLKHDNVSMHSYLCYALICLWGKVLLTGKWLGNIFDTKKQSTKVSNIL